MDIHQSSIVDEGAVIGKNVVIGKFCIIDDGVVIGDNTVVKNYVELRSGTIIGESCYVDSRVSTSGNCKVGNNVTLRYDSILARGVEIGDNTYICPRVMTNNLNEKKDGVGGAKIGANCFIGTNVVLQHGITVVDESIVGSMSFVGKDIVESGVYVGTPAKKIK
tara:strand:+ start:658 stop:1149 length:492 start_codon:yes stop_codon:yes gene_type:complete